MRKGSQHQILRLPQRYLYTSQSEGRLILGESSTGERRHEPKGLQVIAFVQENQCCIRNAKCRTHEDAGSGNGSFVTTQRVKFRYVPSNAFLKFSRCLSHHVSLPKSLSRKSVRR